MSENKLDAEMIRDFKGSPVIPQVYAVVNEKFIVQSNGDVSNIDFQQYEMIRDFKGSPIPNQYFDVNQMKFVVGTLGGGTGGTVATGPTGPRGYSTYDIAVQEGFVGDESAWLESIRGEDGKDGAPGPRGADGLPGTTDYNALNNKPTIPTFTSQLTNDSNFITQAILNALKGGANGIAGLDANGLLSIAQFPAQTKELRVVANLAARDTLDAFEGLGCYIENATPEVTTGGAFYIYNGVSWKKTASDSEFTAVMDWSNILNKPLTFEPSAHTHTIANVGGLQDALEGKVEKVAGKQLSTEDYTAAEKNKLEGLDNYTLPAATADKLGGVKVDGDTISIDENGVISATSKSNFSGDYNDLTNKPKIPATKDDVGLSNVDNIKQMPISGGTLQNYTEKLVTLSTGTIDLSQGNVFTHTLTANTTYAITNAVAGTAHSFTLFIRQGTTARTITFPSSVKWQTVPDLSIVNKEYILSFVTRNGGTTWYGVLGGAY